MALLKKKGGVSNLFSTVSTSPLMSYKASNNAQFGDKSKLNRGFDTDQNNSKIDL